MKKLAIWLGAIVSALLVRSATYNDVVYSTEGDIVPGELTSQFQKAKDYAEKNNIPLVVVWANPGCGFCGSFERLCLGKKTVTDWLKSRGYVAVFCLGQNTTDGSKAWTYTLSTAYPMCRVHWKKNKAGKAVDYKFVGRSGQMHTSVSYSDGLDVQFMSTVDLLCGDYAGGVPTDSFDEIKYALSVASSGNGTVSGGGNYKPGTVVVLKATASKGHVLSGWYSGSQLLSQETTYKHEMGSANLSLTAKFIAKSEDRVKIGAFKAATEYETKREIGPIALSVTGGSLPTLSVTKLPSGLKFTAKEIAGHAANTIYGTPTKSGLYTALISAKTAGGAKASAILPLIIRAKGERIIRVDCDANMGKVSGGGVFADGKKASVRATALSKYCFTGWSIGGTLVSRSASYSYPVDGKDVTLEANFVTKEADLASVRLALGGKEQSPSIVQTNVVRCGVSNSWTVMAKALSGTTVTASGLPSGLKLVNTLVDKELKQYAHEIVGVPTSASKVDSKTKAIKPTVSTIKVTTLGKSSVSYKVAFIIEALPVWAYGTFNGFAAADEHGKGVGVATMTVSASGKISGKFGLFGTNWTYSATGYTSFVNAKDSAKMKFGFEGVAKYSKFTRPFAVEVTPGACNCSVADGEGDDFALKMYRKVWSDKPALVSPKLAKTFLEPLGYDKLALTVSTSGKATFAGKLGDGTSASSSSTVFVDEDDLYKVHLILPMAKKYCGYIDIIDIYLLK